MKESAPARGPIFIWSAVAVLVVLHHDFWFWDDRSLVFGALPVGLFYHLMYSLAAASIWALAIRFAWPRHIEEWASEGDAAERNAEPTRGGSH